jgi:hypothetical protein
VLATCSRATNSGSDSRMTAPVSLTDKFAEALAETGSVKAASKAVGVSRDYGNAMLQRIRKQLGRQAR